MKDLKIILLCSSRFAMPALKELAFFQLLAAVAIPTHCDEMIEHVEAVLTGSGIPIIKLGKTNYSDLLCEAITTYQVNMGLVMTFSFKIPAAVYQLPTKGFFNVHPGPLPQYRGADPVFQQIKNQEKFAGVTIHKLDDGIDTGPVVICEKLKIDTTDTYGLLTTKLSNLAARLTGILIKLSGFGLAIPSRVQDESHASYFKRQQAKDIMINWHAMDADAIIALMNACNPWNKGAVAKMNNQVIRLLVAEKLSADTTNYKEPGKIISLTENGLVIATLNQEAIAVKVLYTEEGFFTSEKMMALGIAAGQQFAPAI